jgi:hypothetical protein
MGMRTRNVCLLWGSIFVLLGVVASQTIQRGPKHDRDYEWVKCGVCNVAMDAIHTHLVRDQSLTAKEDLEDYMDRMCSPADDYGFWITTYDMVEWGAANESIHLKQMYEEGYCWEECRTMAFACKRIMRKLRSAIVKRVKLSWSKKDLREKFCTEHCAVHPGPLPEGRPIGPAWVRKPDPSENVRPIIYKDDNYTETIPIEETGIKFVRTIYDEDGELVREIPINSEADVDRMKKGEAEARVGKPRDPDEEELRL